MSRLRATVQRLGLKRSAVREAVAELALRRSGHFSIDDLVADARAVSLRAHPATIYRVVPLLVEAGLLQPTLLSSTGATRYERAFERSHHDHLICTSCGVIVEFFSEPMEALQREIADRFHFSLEDHVLELRGVCEKCRSARSETAV